MLSIEGTNMQCAPKESPADTILSDLVVVDHKQRTRKAKSFDAILFESESAPGGILWCAQDGPWFNTKAPLKMSLKR